MTDLDALREELQALCKRVRDLEDHRDLGQLVVSYGPAVDSGSAEAAASLWSVDGRFAVVGGERSFTMDGNAAVADMVAGSGHQSLIAGGCAHVLTAPQIEVDGDGAMGRSYALNIRWDPAADRFWVARVSANRWRWRRVAGTWKVEERINANLDGAEAARALFRSDG